MLTLAGGGRGAAAGARWRSCWPTRLQARAAAARCFSSVSKSNRDGGWIRGGRSWRERVTSGTLTRQGAHAGPVFRLRVVEHTHTSVQAGQRHLRDGWGWNLRTLRLRQVSQGCSRLSSPAA